MGDQLCVGSEILRGAAQKAADWGCRFAWSSGFTRRGWLEKYYFKEDLMLPFKVKEARLSAMCVSVSHFPLSLLLFFDLPTNTFCVGNMF